MRFANYRFLSLHSTICLSFSLLLGMATPYHACAQEKLSYEDTYVWHFIDNGDSILNEKIMLTIDEQQRHIREDRIEYTVRDKNTVEDYHKYFVFDPKKSTGEIGEAFKGESNSKTVKMLYKNFTGQATNSPMLRRREYDSSGELVREDTFTYNPHGLLQSKCAYNYTGSTSKFCTINQYDKKDRLTKETIYYYWNTVKGNGRTVEERDVQQKTKICYNASGKVKRRRIKGFGTNIKECFTYGPDQKLSEHVLIRKVESSVNGKPGKTTTNKEVTTEKYHAGKLSSSITTVNGKETNRVENELADTLITKQRFFMEGKLNKEVNHLYDNGHLQEFSECSYRNNQKADERIVNYNKNGEITAEKRLINGKVQLDYRYDYKYNSDQLKISETKFSGNIQLYEIHFVYNEYKKLKQTITFSSNSRITDKKYISYR